MSIIKSRKKKKRAFVSKAENEYIVLFDKDKKSGLKKIPFYPHNHWHKLTYVIAICVLITGVVLFPFQEQENKQTSEYDDENKKNEILFSSETDYSQPKKVDPLRIMTYKVKSGDSLSVIARNYGVSIDTVCGSNNLRSYDLINVGKVLKIPNKDGVLAILKKGQKLISLAIKYKVDIKKIIAANNFINPDFIAVGETIFIPDAKPMNIFPGWLWPTYSRVINSGYGYRIHPIFHRRFFHKGLDIRSRYQNVRSTKYGKITFAGWLGGYGKAVIIAHPGGWKSLYGHLSRIYVKRGQYVKQGQFIGKSGNTGRSTGPHLHFEMIKKGRHVNPYHNLKRR